MHADGEAVGQKTPPWFDWSARIAAVLLLLALGALVATEAVDAGRAGFVAGIVIVCLVILAVSLSRFAQVESVKAFGVELKIAQASMASAPIANLAYDGETGQEKDISEIVDLQFLLEAKLTYVAKHLLGFDGRGHWSPFLTLGSLKYDEYLSREDAIAARHLLGLQSAAVQGASEEDRRAYLAKAKPFVRNIRATIFHDVVKTVLEKDFRLSLEHRDRGGSRRPDFELSANRLGHVLVFPAFAGGGGYWNRERIERRAADLAQHSDRALIVVPPNAHVSDPGVEGVAVTRLDELVHTAAAGRSFDSLLPGGG